MKLTEQNMAIYEAWKAAPKPKPSFQTLAEQFLTTRNRIAGAIWRGRRRDGL
jgi:hypothetical protein